MFVRTGTIILIVAILSIPAGLSAADDAMMGTWKEIGLMPPQTNVRKYAPAPGGFTMNRDGVGSDGKEFQVGYTVKFDDGKYYKVIGAPGLDEIKIHRVDGYTWETLSKKDGKPRSIGHWVVSHDGKWLILLRRAASNSDIAGRENPWRAQVFQRVSDKATDVKAY